MDVRPTISPPTSATSNVCGTRPAGRFMPVRCPGQGLEIGNPWHRGLKAEAKAKGESLRCHHLMSGPECRLVVSARRPEPQGRAHWLPAAVCRIACRVTVSG